MIINGNSSITYVGQEPAPAGGGEGAKDQAVTEPDIEDSGTVGEEGQESEQDNDPEGGQESGEEYKEENLAGDEKPPMSKDERVAAAKRRRKLENRELERKIREEEQTKAENLINSVISGMRLRDDSGRPITTREELDAYNAQRDQQIIDEGLDRAGIDRDVIDTVIANHPAIKAAQSVVEKAETEMRRAQDMTTEERGKQQLELITGMDPAVTDMETLRGHESYERVYDRVRSQGLSISDAFYLENRSAIEKRRVDAAVQQAMNLSRGKGHLTHDASHGGGEVIVPEGVKRGYRNAYPGISDTEIQQKYKAVMSTKKKG